MQKSSSSSDRVKNAEMEERSSSSLRKLNELEQKPHTQTHQQNGERSEKSKSNRVTDDDRNDKVQSPN